MAGAYVPYADVYSQPYYPRESARYDEQMQDSRDAVVRQRQREAYARPPVDHGRQRERYLNEARANRRSRERRGSSAPDHLHDRRDGRQQRRGRASSESSDSSDSRSREPGRGRVDDDRVARQRTRSEADRAVRRYDGDLRSRAGRYLDASPNGVLAAAAGAGVGAIATRRFGDRDHFEKGDGSDKWKTIAGALVGGLAANAAENRWKRYGEDKDRQLEARQRAEAEGGR